MRKTLWSLVLPLALAACSSAPVPQNITIEATDIQYSTKTFEVQANQPVILTYVNNGVLDHDFSITAIPVKDVEEQAEESGTHMMDDPTMVEPDLHIAPKPGTTGTLTFTPTEPGTYEFFCTVAGHKDAGMMGTLIVK